MFCLLPFSFLVILHFISENAWVPIYFYFSIFTFLFILATFEKNTNIRQAFRLYRGPFLIIEFLFLMGINVYGWRSSGVNHVLIFELDPRKHVTEQHLFEIAGILGVVCALSILGYLYSDALSIPAYINPLSLIILFTLLMLNPLKMFYFEARFWLLRIMVYSFICHFIFDNLKNVNFFLVANGVRSILLCWFC